MKNYTYHEKSFSFIETKDAYITPYSLFMLENYPLNIQQHYSICDYGAGTGILGIVASYHNPARIVFIETNESSHTLIQKNYELNNKENNTTVEIVQTSNECHNLFDTIVCNPASLPDFINAGSFCNGGPLGLDMILSAGEFAANYLKPDGKLYIIITSLLPTSIIWNEFERIGLTWREMARKRIQFREHYSGIREWVDKLHSIYPEMRYYEENKHLFECLSLYEISRGQFLIRNEGI